MKHFLKGVFTLISIVCFSINTHGFVGDTLVHTESGMKPIKSIYQNYSPYEISLDCCDETTFSLSQQRMIKAAEGECQHKIRITFENNGSAFAIECAPYQSFYVVGKRKSGYAINGTPEADVINCIDWLISDTLLGPSYAGKRVAAECGIGAWTRACDIKLDDYLFCKKGWHRWVSEVALIEVKTTMYTLEVEHAHTYFVGSIQVLAHNSPLLLAGAALSWGETAYFGTAALASMWAAAQATGELLVPNQITYYAAGTSIPTEAGIEAAEIVLSENIKKAIPAVTCLALTGYFTYQCIQEMQRVYYAIQYSAPYVAQAIKNPISFPDISGVSHCRSSVADLTISPLMNAVYAGQSPYGSYVLPQKQQEKGTQVPPPVQAHVTDEKGKGSGGGGGPEKEPDDEDKNKNSVVKAVGTAATGISQNEEFEKKVVEGVQSVKEFIQHVVSAAGQAVKDGRVKYEVTKVLEGSMPHIFRNEPGHFEKATPENIKFLLDIAKDMKNFIDFDKRGNAWFHKILEDGTQVWISAWNQTIRNAGINDVIHQFDPDTGLAYNMMKFK